MRLVSKNGKQMKESKNYAKSQDARYAVDCIINFGVHVMKRSDGRESQKNMIGKG